MLRLFNVVTLGGVSKIWLRFSRTISAHPYGALINCLLSPVLQAVAFGFGLGAIVPKVEIAGQVFSYQGFVLSGLLGAVALSEGFFRGSYGVYLRMNSERLYKLIASSPLTIQELVLGELAWGGTMACFACLPILALGYFNQVLMLSLMPIAILLIFLGGCTFTALGMICAGLVADLAQLEYCVNAIFIPLLLFSGIYFPLQQLPPTLKYLASALPVSGLVDTLRHVLIGTPFNIEMLLSVLFWVTLTTGLALRIILKKHR